MKCWIAIAATIMSATFGLPPSAQAAEGESPSYSVDSLVMMLSSESACHLSYEKSAIERFIQHFTDQNQSVPNLGSLVSFDREYVVGKMTPSTLIAHCAQVRSVAKLYQFVK